MLPQNSSIPSASAVALTTATPANVASVVLSPGNYLVWGVVDAALAGATLTGLTAALSLTSATLSTQNGSNVAGARLYPDPIAQAVKNLVTATGTESLAVGPTVAQVPPGQTPTLYLVAQGAFSAGTVAAFGSIFALPLPN